MCWSGRNDGLHHGGVAVILSKTTSKSLVERGPSAINTILKSNHSYLTVMQCYSPINDDKEEEKDEFCEKLNGITVSNPKHDTLIVMGDMNAKVCEDNIGMKYLMVVRARV